MRDIVKIHEFFVEGENTTDSHVLLHISEPSIDEDGKGYFFALCEIKHGTSELIGHIQKMIDDIEDLYYSTKISTQKNSFEYSIDQINRRSHHILSDKETELNLLFGVIEKENVFFASRGNILNHLLYYKKGELQHVRITEEQNDASQQIFPALIEGQMKNNDYFIITTEKVEKLFPLDRIEKILPQKDAKSTAWQIQKTLEQLQNTTSLGGLILHKPTSEELPRYAKLPKVAKPIQATLPEQKGLIGTTLNKISESLNKNNTIDNGIFNPQPKPFLESERAKSPAQKPLPRIVVSIAGGIAFTGAFIIQTFQWLLRGIVASFRFLFILITNSRGQRQKAIHNFEVGFQNKIHWFKNLPILSKIFFFLSILSIAGLLGSIVYHNHQVFLETQLNDYNGKVENIQKEKDTADRSILYGDTKTAFNALNNAKSQLELLENHPNKNAEQIKNISEAIESSLMQIRKQTDVVTVQKADILALFPSAQVENMVRLGNLLYIFGQNDTSSYTVNLDTAEVLQKNHNTIPLLKNGSSPKEYDKVVFPLDATHIAEYTKETDALSSKDIAYPNDTPEITSLFIYNRKLYTLDTKNNQIYRHNQTANGYDKGTAWITEQGVDLFSGVSFAIDGDLYILHKNGTIQKFSAGVGSPFSATAIDPPLQNPTQLWTYNDVNNIYILDPGTKRIVVIDKNGNVVKQYSSSEWKKPTSMVVDEPNKKIYILESGKILEFKI